jgi:hypothetical protein
VIVQNLIFFLCEHIPPLADFPGFAQALGRAVHYGDKWIRENIPSEVPFCLGNKAAES